MANTLHVLDWMKYTPCKWWKGYEWDSLSESQLADSTAGNSLQLLTYTSLALRAQPGCDTLLMTIIRFHVLSPFSVSACKLTYWMLTGYFWHSCGRNIQHICMFGFKVPSSATVTLSCLFSSFVKSHLCLNWPWPADANVSFHCIWPERRQTNVDWVVQPYGWEMIGWLTLMSTLWWST